MIFNMAKKRKKVTTIFNQLKLVEQMLDSGEIPAVLQDSHYRLLHMVLRYYYYDLNLRGNDLLAEMLTFIHDFDIDFFGGLDEILSDEALSKLTPLHRDDKTIKFYRSEIDTINESELSSGAKRLLFAMLWFKKTKLAINESADYLFDNSLVIYNNLDDALATGKGRNDNLQQLAEHGFISIGMSLDARAEIKDIKQDGDNEVVFEKSEVTSSKEAFEMLIGSLRRRNFIVINIAEYFENGSYFVVNTLAQAKGYVPLTKITDICERATRFQYRGYTLIEIEDGRLLLDDYKELRDKLVCTHMTLVKTDFTKLRKSGFKLQFSIDGNEIMLTNDHDMIIV